MMMSFCKKSVHSVLGTYDNGTLLKPPPPPRCQNIPSLFNGLSLIAVTGNNTLKPPSNVLESTIIKSTSTSAPTSPGSESFSQTTKKDPGGIGFVDDIGGGVDGLMSCTESLGFESTDERRTDDQLDRLLEMNGERENELCSATRNQRRKRIKVRSEPKNFPPPLSSLKQNGQPSFYLRPMRKDGRLELIQVRNDRTEVLHASRRDGRLRLHLIRDDIQDIKEDDDEEEIDEEIEEERVREERESVDEWKSPSVTNAGGGDGLRRCYDLVNHHHNHHGDLRMWSQRHYVTTG